MASVLEVAGVGRHHCFFDIADLEDVVHGAVFAADAFKNHRTVYFFPSTVTFMRWPSCAVWKASIQITISASLEVSTAKVLFGWLQVPFALPSHFSSSFITCPLTILFLEENAFHAFQALLDACELVCEPGNGYRGDGVAQLREQFEHGLLPLLLLLARPNVQESIKQEQCPEAKKCPANDFYYFHHAYFLQSKYAARAIAAKPRTPRPEKSPEEVELV